ncbi:TRAP transporter substrate-binding protein DctP [Caldimonas tepidiphila]|uniref:TRAP transporter substrate-binding protein DctP n=1 Tax=Caldimonas tepidiphila TaxID=2315841 RepID=UPI0013007F83|nr:TRAP transporter substrate-binding protein DctP [Caldimonas tepidiphila]
MRIRPRRAVPWLLAAAALLQAAPPVQAREFKGWSVHADGYPVNQGMQRFAAAVAAVTKGAHTARVYPDSELGPQGQVLDKLASGEIDFAVTGLVGYGEKVPALRVLGMPYMFHDSARMFALLDGPLGELLAGELEKAGVILLGWYDGGTRNFYHRSRPLDSVHEFKDVKLRVGTTRTHIDMVERMGAHAVPLPFKDVYRALEEGRVDGAENNLPSYESTGHYKLAPHYTFTRHLVTPEMLVIGKKAWNEFTKEQQQALLLAGRQSALHMREEWNRRVRETQARLEKEGVKFYDCKDYGPMVRRLKSLYEPLWSAKDSVSVQALSLILAGMAQR